MITMIIVLLIIKTIIIAAIKNKRAQALKNSKQQCMEYLHQSFKPPVVFRWSSKEEATNIC